MFYYIRVATNMESDEWRNYYMSKVPILDSAPVAEVTEMSLIQQKLRKANKRELHLIYVFIDELVPTDRL